MREKSEKIQGISLRKDGPDWRETNIALRQLMQDYAGMVKDSTSHAAAVQRPRGAG